VSFWEETIMNYPAGMAISAPLTSQQSGILTLEALDFIAGLARSFEPLRSSLLARRVQRQAELDAGRLPDFLPGTAAVRKVTLEMVRAMIPEALAIITSGVAEHRFVPGNYEHAAQVFEQLIATEPMIEFLTNHCYQEME
jgi:malate synthase